MAWIWVVANLVQHPGPLGKQGQGWEFSFVPLLRNQGQMLIRKVHCLLRSLWDSRARVGGPEHVEGPSLLSKGGRSPRAVMSQILANVYMDSYLCMY